MSSFEGSNSGSADGPPVPRDDKDQSANHGFERFTYLPPLSVITENLTPFKGHASSIPRPPETFPQTAQDTAPIVYSFTSHNESRAGNPYATRPPPYDRHQLLPALQQNFVMRTDAPPPQPISQREHINRDPQFAINTPQNLTYWPHPNQRTVSNPLENPPTSDRQMPSFNSSLQSLGFTDGSRSAKLTATSSMPLPYDVTRQTHPVRFAPDPRSHYYMGMPASDVAQFRPTHSRQYQPPFGSSSTSKSSAWDMPYSAHFSGFRHPPPRMPHHSAHRTQSVQKKTPIYSGMTQPPPPYNSQTHWTPNHAHHPPASAASALWQRNHFSHNFSEGGRDHWAPGGREVLPTHPQHVARGIAQAHGGQGQNVEPGSAQVQANGWQGQNAARGSAQAHAWQGQHVAQGSTQAHGWQGQNVSIPADAYHQNLQSVLQSAPSHGVMGSVEQAREMSAGFGRNQEGFFRSNQAHPPLQNP